LNFISNEPINRAEIINLTGKILLSKTGTVTSISLANISAGVYILRYKTAKETKSEKLIVK